MATFEDRIAELKEEFATKKKSAEFKMMIRKEAILSIKSWMSEISEKIEIASDECKYTLPSIAEATAFRIEKHEDRFLEENLSPEQYKKYCLSTIKF
jgi:hypothetical protein